MEWTGDDNYLLDASATPDGFNIVGWFKKHNNSRGDLVRVRNKDCESVAEFIGTSGGCQVPLLMVQGESDIVYCSDYVGSLRPRLDDNDDNDDGGTNTSSNDDF